jgi:hypothetical protein
MRQSHISPARLGEGDERSYLQQSDRINARSIRAKKLQLTFCHLNNKVRNAIKERARGG